MTDRVTPASPAAGRDVPAAAERLADIPLPRRSRAARLIEQLVGSGHISAADLAAAIVVSDRTLAECRSGHARVPLERQLCLALLACELSPLTRRAGFALRAQVEAQMAVGTTRTETHNEPPVSHRWPNL